MKPVYAWKNTEWIMIEYEDDLYRHYRTVEELPEPEKDFVRECLERQRKLEEYNL